MNIQSDILGLDLKVVLLSVISWFFDNTQISLKRRPFHIALCCWAVGRARVKRKPLLFGFSSYRELYVTRTLRKFDVVAVVGFHLASVGAGRKWFIQNVRQPVNALVDIIVLGCRR